MTEAELAAVMRAIAPVVREYVTKAASEGGVRERLAVAEARLERSEAAVTALTQETVAQRERLATIEARPLEPGPVGPPGPPGRDGIDGKAGLRYRGIYDGAHTYEPGDLVTWAGSTWHCQAATTSKPGEYAGAQAWILCVKKGRDGRDGKDGRP
jgi:hypothetical protein